MKRLMFLAVIASLATACGTASPDAGHEVVLVYKPLFVGHGGVDPTPVKTGLSYVALTTSTVDIPMVPQRVDMEFDDMMTSSGVPVNFHVVATFQIVDSVKLVQGFGADWDQKEGWGFWSRNLDQPLRTAVRDSVKKRDMQEMAISQTAADAVGEEVRTAADKVIASAGVPIKLTAMNVGRVNPPDSIKHQRVETATQEQRIITEQQRKLAEDQRKAAEEARAAADNAYNERMRLSPEQYVRLQQIAALRDVCGSGKCTFVSGAMPLIDIK